MYCTGCGVEVDQHARFCSSCGKEVVAGAQEPAFAPPLLSPHKQRDWSFHVSLLGWIFIAHSAIAGLIGLAVMFGGELARRIMVSSPGVFPPDMPPEASRIVGPVTFLIGLIFFVIAIPSVAAGVGLLQYRSWGRVLTLVMSVLRVLSFPLGTAIAIYAFWVLLSEEGGNFYRERSAQSV